MWYLFLESDDMTPPKKRKSKKPNRPLQQAKTSAAAKTGKSPAAAKASATTAKARVSKSKASKAPVSKTRTSLSAGPLSGLLVPDHLPYYWQLTRMNRPIGWLLLLWPTLWGLWLAADGLPDLDVLLIFVLGVISMRAAGCAINDFADRKVDGHVKRTRERPLASGKIQPREALAVCVLLCLLSFILVLFTNKLTILLSLGAVALAGCYPFMKRYTHLPQVVLGAAFAWSIPMGFAAQTGEVPPESWLIYTAAVIWTVVYDTFYAMVDRDDDLLIGVKSTAVLFGEQDRVITGSLQVLVIVTLMMVGQRFELGSVYYLGLAVAAGLFVYQQFLIRHRDRDQCFKAFLNNNWAGFAVFAGIVGDYLVR